MRATPSSSGYEFYRDYFPADLVWRLFAARAADRPEKREFSCELEIDADGAIVWKRYVACAHPVELAKMVSGRSFRALHIGPSFSESASGARRPGVFPVAKELVFDLDLQDVAWFDVDKANQAANDRYVRAIFASCYVLIEILREVMGFERFVPVYSGRRGVHLWVLDERAFAWGDDARAALCAFVASTPSKGDPRVINTRHIRSNPSFGDGTWAAVARAGEALLRPFAQGGVGLLDKPRDVDSFIAKLVDVEVVPHDAGRKRERKHVACAAKLAASGHSGVRALQGIREAVASNAFYANRLDDVLLSLVWPAIDVGATAKINHCSKSVFSLHAKTGRVAVPVPQLFSDATYVLPPIVLPSHLGDRASASRRCFDQGVALLEDALRGMAAGAEGGGAHEGEKDIEDLVAAPMRKCARVGGLRRGTSSPCR